MKTPMKTPSRKSAPKSLPPAVSDLVAEGGNILASDDAKKLTVTPVGIAGDSAMLSGKARSPQVKRRAGTTR